MQLTLQGQYMQLIHLWVNATILAKRCNFIFCNKGVYCYATNDSWIGNMCRGGLQPTVDLMQHYL